MNAGCAARSRSSTRIFVRWEQSSERRPSWWRRDRCQRLKHTASSVGKRWTVVCRRVRSRPQSLTPLNCLATILNI